MSFFGLFFMAFFWVCGGIYGGEGVMQLGPAGVIFATLGFTMAVYALPIALINAELAVAIPEDGGIVVWVQRAFGPMVGGHNSWWIWTSYTFDAAIYPVLAASYLSTALGISADHPNYSTIIIAMAEVVVVLVTCMKLMGSGVVVKFATLASMVSLAPAAVFVGWGFITVPLKPERWFAWTGPAHPGAGGSSSWDDSGSWLDTSTVKWELLISWMLWLNSGYLGLGALAAGVDNPKRTFPLIVFTIIPFVAVVIIAPFLVSLSVNDNMDNYEAGYFSDLAEQVAGPWLKDCFTVGAVMCMVALYANTIITSEVSLQYFTEQYFPSMVAKPSDSNCRRWLIGHDDYGAAPVYIFFNGMVASVLVLLPYKVLIEFTMTLMALPCLLFLAAFVWLRIKEPELQRDFKIPGGVVACTLMAIPPAALTLTQMYFAFTGSGEGSGGMFIGTWEVPHPSLLATVLIVSMGFVAHLLAACCGWGAEQSSLSSPTSPPWSERESLLIDEENKRMGTIN